jgi:hypothetical protein
METNNDYRALEGTLTPSGMSVAPAPSEEPIASTPVPPARPRRHLWIVVTVIVTAALAVLVLAGTQMLDERGKESVASVAAVNEVLDYELVLERATDEDTEEAKTKETPEPKETSEPEETTTAKPAPAEPTEPPRAESTPNPVQPAPPGVVKPSKPAAPKKSLSSW